MQVVTAEFPSLAKEGQGWLGPVSATNKLLYNAYTY